MALGIIGKKIGMSRVYSADGSAPCRSRSWKSVRNRITQVKTEKSDGYRAVQVTIGERRASRVTKSLAGHYAKASVAPGRGLWEFRLEAGEGETARHRWRSESRYFRRRPDGGRAGHDYR